MGELKYIHPKPKNLKRFEECRDLEWWTHPEIVDWNAHQAGEKERWLALPIEEKRAETDDLARLCGKDVPDRG